MSIRRAWLALAITTILVACNAQEAPSASPASAPPLPAVAAPTINACGNAFQQLSGFTSQVIPRISALRPIAVARSFDANESLAATRQVAALLTTYSGLDETLQSCDATESLASRASSLLDSLHLATGAALEAQLTDAAVLRNADVALFGHLPELIKLAEDGADAARIASAPFAATNLAAGATDPIGSLPPLPTATPQATARVAVRQPPATQRPTGSSSSGWNLQAYETAMKYEDSVWLTYGDTIPTALWNSGAKLFGATCSYEVTPEARAACFDSETKSIYQPIRNAIAAHRTFMKKHPPARCFADAYAADRSAADAYITATNYLAATLKDTGAVYTADFKGWDKWIAIAQSRSDLLMKKFEGFFADCR